MTETNRPLRLDDIFRPSKLAVFYNCPGSPSLLIGSEKKPVGAAAEEGTRLHTSASVAIAVGETCDNTSYEFLWTRCEEHGTTKEEFDEVIYPWLQHTQNLATGADYNDYEVGVTIDDLGLKGTCDFFAYHQAKDGEPPKVIISDLKTGRGLPIEAEGNTQLRAYAAGTFDNGKIMGEEIDPETIFELWIFQPRSMHGKQVSVERLKLDDLIQFKHEFQGILVAYQTATPEERTAMLNPGKHCRYCEAVMDCPAARVEFLDFLNQATPNAIREADPKALAELCSMNEMAKGIFGAIQDNLVDAVDDSSVEGWKIVERQGIRSWKAEDIVDIVDYLKRVGVAEQNDETLHFTAAMPLTPAKLKAANKAAFEALVGNMHQGNPSRSLKRVK